MPYQLKHFWDENHGLFPGDTGQKLLLYTAFVQSFCYQYQIPFESSSQLEGLLPKLFRQISGYEIKDAAVTFDSAMPWGLLHENPRLTHELTQINNYLYRAACATPTWLRRQVDELLELDHTFSGATVTPPSIRSLIAQLAAEMPARQIIELCSGTCLLGLQIWEALGSDPLTPCYGEEINSFLCAFSRLLLFLCGVEKFSVKERNIMDALPEPQDQFTGPCIYVADFPLAGNRTFPVSEDDPLFDGKQVKLYADWLLIRSVLNRMRSGDRAFLLVTKGALVRQNERILREHLVRQGWLEAVIKLPAGLYPNHNLPLNLLICQKGRNTMRQDQIFFADLSSFSTPGTRRTRMLSQSGISRLCEAFRKYSDEDGFSKVASSQDILLGEFSLYPSVYLAKSGTTAEQLRIKDIAVVVRGLQLPKGNPAVQQTPRYLLNIRDLQDGEIHYENTDQIEAENPAWDEKYLIQEDDIILTSKGSALKLAIVPPDPPAAYISGNLTLIRVKPALYSPYILYEYLTSEEGLNTLNLIQTGTTIRVLGSGNLEQLAIPVYDRSLSTDVGLALKQAALQYQHDLERIKQTYFNQKEALLSQLSQGKELKNEPSVY